MFVCVFVYQAVPPHSSYVSELNNRVVSVVVVAGFIFSFVLCVKKKNSPKKNIVFFILVN